MCRLERSGRDGKTCLIHSKCFTENACWCVLAPLPADVRSQHLRHVCRGTSVLIGSSAPRLPLGRVIGCQVTVPAPLQVDDWLPGSSPSRSGVMVGSVDSVLLPCPSR
ncbi:hypothetical protein COCON_G00231550 [Conger conger]|uniref:Uncharacterized protein n=1 Tax=Conger conger TaxID=82655 RepID=A0A9Q1CVM4_CONCO|nr:hypothetical protein COCON_G00231550 [Conger conger]